METIFNCTSWYEQIKTKISINFNPIFQNNAANILTIAFGITEGWTSPAIFLLMTDDTPLPSGKLSIEEASWVASVMCKKYFSI